MHRTALSKLRFLAKPSNSPAFRQFHSTRLIRDEKIGEAVKDESSTNFGPKQFKYFLDVHKDCYEGCCKKKGSVIKAIGSLVGGAILTAFWFVFFAIALEEFAGFELRYITLSKKNEE
jgi:hypothetical protein